MNTARLNLRLSVAALIFVVVLIGVTSLVSGYLSFAIFWPLAIICLAKSFYDAGKAAGKEAK